MAGRTTEESGDVVAKELVARRAVEDFGRDGQQPEVQIATTQENIVNLNQENNMVSQVPEQGLDALRARLASIPEAKPSQQEVM